MRTVTSLKKLDQCAMGKTASPSPLRIKYEILCEQDAPAVYSVEKGIEKVLHADEHRKPRAKIGTRAAREARGR